MSKTKAIILGIYSIAVSLQTTFAQGGNNCDYQKECTNHQIKVIMRNFKKTLLSAAISLMTVNANAFPWISPYAYCFNNPIKFIDPDGERPKASEAALMAAYVYGREVKQYEDQLKKNRLDNLPFSNIYPDELHPF